MKGKGLEIAPLHNAIKFNQETTTRDAYLLFIAEGGIIESIIYSY
jgi:hypothetical protein